MVHRGTVQMKLFKKNNQVSEKFLKISQFTVLNSILRTIGFSISKLAWVILHSKLIQKGHTYENQQVAKK